MTVADAPSVELGYQAGVVPIYTPGGTGFTVESMDLNVDLTFPASAVVFDRMGREDGQVVSVIRAIVQAIVSARRTLGGTDVRPEVAAFVRTELGLDDQGRARRRRQGIVHRHHRRESATAMLRYGFMPYEQVYDVGPAAPGLTDPAYPPGRLYAHLRKLGARNPRTLSEVRVAADGGLSGIVQAPRPGTTNPNGVFIPTDRLVMYVNEQEGADWTGVSALRASYKHWLVKDALIRLGAQVVERNGMGLPVVEYAEPKYKTEALALSRALRAGSTAGAAVEQGKIRVNIVGTQGSIVDGLPWVKYHDEAIGRTLLAMVLNLGHDGGLGSATTSQTFADLLAEFINSINAYLDEVDTEHIIRDLVELNYGPDEPYPVLTSEDVTGESEPTAEALKALADAKLLTPDRPTEDALRVRYRLPPVDDATRAPIAPTYDPAVDPAVPVLAGPEDTMVTRLSEVTERLAALRAGHQTP